jgi:dienelactone hydrolase
VKLRAAETAKAFVIDMWLARHTPEKVLPVLYKVIEAAKEEFADAIANGGGIYAVGYCFGGKYVLLLAGERSDIMLRGQVPENERTAVHKGPLIKVGALAHGR